MEIELEETANVDNKKINFFIISCNNERDKLSYAASSLHLELEDEVTVYSGPLEEKQ